MRVAIFEEHEIFRRGLVAAVGDAHGLEVVVAATSAEDGVDYDVCVTSPVGYQGVRSQVPAVVCAGPNQGNSLTTTGNVYAVLSRAELTPEQLVAAIHAAAQGFRLESDDLTPATEFDDRTRAVLELLSEGARTRDISEKLGYSERTIKGIIQDIEGRLGARSRAHAVAVGIRRGLI